MNSSKANTYFIIDFDSTFATVESLEELASITLKTKPDRKKILEQIKHITNLGMEGKISFTESLERRLLLFQTTKKDINTLIKNLKKNITPSVKNNKEFFTIFSKNIYIVSGGFKEFISPIVKMYGIDENHVLANTFTFDKKGRVTGFDKTNPLSRDGGKVEVMKKLNLKGTVYIVGDGFTDYEIRKNGHAKKFFAFTENIKRQTVMEKADYVSASFDEILYRLRLPRALSFPKTMMKALLIGESLNFARQILEKEGYSVTSLPTLKNYEDFQSILKIIRVLIIDTTSKLPNNLLGHAPKLLTIGLSNGTYENSHIKKAAEKGIALFATSNPSFSENEIDKELSEKLLCKKIIRFINTGDTRSSVNLPEVSLPRLKNAHRFIHIHHNKPGVLANLNKVLADNHINIDGQYLKTNSLIGYAITDVYRDYSKKVLNDLKSIPETIRVRVLY